MRHLPVCVKLLEPSGALFLSSAGGSLFTLRDVLDARHSNVARGTMCGANCTRVSRHGAGCPVPAWWNGRHARLKICFLYRSAGSSPAAGTINSSICSVFKGFSVKLIHWKGTPMTHFTASDLTTANLIELLFARLEADNDYQGMILLADLEGHRADVLLQDVAQMTAVSELKVTNSVRGSQESLESRSSSTLTS